MKNHPPSLENCELCEWKCGVNRLEGETGVCRTEKPSITSTMLHPAPPESYTIFLNGCNFKCLNCQNWKIAHQKEQSKTHIEPEKIAKEAIKKINSQKGKTIGADRIFFSGGSPGISLPYIEKIVEKAREENNVKVNFDTNGFLTINSLKRVIKFTTSITFDIKAYHNDTHRALTGAPVNPVLRNAKYIIENAREKLWEFRIPLIPEIVENEIQPIAKFLKKIDPTVPVNLLAFRPNFVMEKYKGATSKLMENAVKKAKQAGLENINWSGSVGISGNIPDEKNTDYNIKGAQIAGGIAEKAGCNTHPRDCGNCNLQNDCPITGYIPSSIS